MDRDNTNKVKEFILDTNKLSSAAKKEVEEMIINTKTLDVSKLSQDTIDEIKEMIKNSTNITGVRRKRKNHK